MTIHKLFEEVFDDEVKDRWKNYEILQKKILDSQSLKWEPIVSVNANKSASKTIGFEIYGIDSANRNFHQSLEKYKEYHINILDAKLAWLSLALSIIPTIRQKLRHVSDLDSNELIMNVKLEHTIINSYNFKALINYYKPDKTTFFELDSCKIPVNIIENIQKITNANKLNISLNISNNLNEYVKDSLMSIANMIVVDSIYTRKLLSKINNAQECQGIMQSLLKFLREKNNINLKTINSEKIIYIIQGVENYEEFQFIKNWHNEDDGDINLQGWCLKVQKSMTNFFDPFNSKNNLPKGYRFDFAYKPEKEKGTPDYKIPYTLDWSLAEHWKKCKKHNITSEKEIHGSVPGDIDDKDSQGIAFIYHLAFNYRLSGFDLRYACFYNSRVWNSEFRGVNLSGSDLFYSQFKKCSFNKSDLSSVKIYKTIFDETSFIDTNICESNFRNTRFKNTNLGHTKINNSALINTAFEEAEFNRTAFTFSTLLLSDFSNADLTGVTFKYSNLESVNFEGANLYNADLTGSNLSSIKISEDTDFRGAILKKIIITKETAALIPQEIKSKYIESWKFAENAKEAKEIYEDETKNKFSESQNIKADPEEEKESKKQTHENTKSDLTKWLPHLKNWDKIMKSNKKIKDKKFDDYNDLSNKMKSEIFEFVTELTKKGELSNNLLEILDLERIKDEKKVEEEKNIKPSMKCFISYSHKDDDLRKSLEEHLSPLRREKLLVCWRDIDILAGNEIDTEINEELEKSQIILLLVSASFINSEYCYGKEMKYAIKRHDDKTAKVIPIILRDCLWQVTPFAKLKALPKDGNAVSSWDNPDLAFTDIAKEILKVIEDMMKNLQSDK